LIQATQQTVQTETNGSVLEASRTDARFNRHEKYPNQWQATRGRDGEGKAVVRGEAAVYDGNGIYIKVTKLDAPRSVLPSGGVFVEYHARYVEPEAWFGNRDVVRSKLKLELSNKIGDFRRRLAKASKGR